MLVAVREYRQEEVRGLCASSSSSSSSLVSYYNLVRGRGAVVVADVADTRARRVVPFDFYAAGAHELLAVVGRPLLEGLPPPAAAPQSLAVVDGSHFTRVHTLLHPREGLVGHLWRLLQHEEAFTSTVEAIHIAAVELKDNNQLRDLSPQGVGREPAIIEDTEDHFTAIEDACYTEIRDESDMQAFLQLAQQTSSPTRHQVYSFIITFKESVGLPNATIQFVSLALAEMGRGVRSTRHCITTVASLIESQSPSITFDGTKISFLLKPALLGRQPGIWISCFSPMSPPDIQHRETFKESFSIAYTACRIYSSRVGVNINNISQFNIEPEINQLFNSSDEYIEIQPRKDIPQPSISGIKNKFKKKVKNGASSLSSSPSRTLLSSSSLSSSPSSTINGEKENRIKKSLKSKNFHISSSQVPKDTTTGLLVTPSTKKKEHLSENTRLTSCTRDVSSSISTQKGLNRQLHDRCSSLEKHPYNCSARYELETYRRVMEPAMNQLRKDVKHYLSLLEDAKRQIHRFKQGKDTEREKKMEIEIDKLRLSLLESRKHCDTIITEYTKREKEFQNKIMELQSQCNNLTHELHHYIILSEKVVENEENKKEKKILHSISIQTPTHFLPTMTSNSLFHGEDDLVKSQTRQEQQLPLKEQQQQQQSTDLSHASQWLEVIDYHQKELEEHVQRERAYRNRIVNLEQALNERDAMITQVKSELAKRDQQLSLEAVKYQQIEREREMEREFTEGLEQIREELILSQKNCTETENRFKVCLNELQQERKQREIIESELRNMKTTFSQQKENNNSKEVIQLLKESYEKQFQLLQREVEDLRQRSQKVNSSKEMTPIKNNSTASTPKNSVRGRLSSGMMSPAIETQGNIIISAHHHQQQQQQPNEDTNIIYEPTTRLQAIPMTGEVRRFEDFMKEESSYNLRLPKSLERMRS